MSRQTQTRIGFLTASDAGVGPRLTDAGPLTATTGFPAHPTVVFGEYTFHVGSLGNLARR